MREGDIRKQEGRRMVMRETEWARGFCSTALGENEVKMNLYFFLSCGEVAQMCKSALQRQDRMFCCVLVKLRLEKLRWEQGFWQWLSRSTMGITLINYKVVIRSQLKPAYKHFNIIWDTSYEVHWIIKGSHRFSSKSNLQVSLPKKPSKWHSKI